MSRTVITCEDCGMITPEEIFYSTHRCVETADLKQQHASALARIAELEAENAELRHAYEVLKIDEEWLRMMFDRVHEALEVTK